MPSPVSSSPASLDDPWFEYQVRVYPHHTDYAGVVWHGTYVAWMEAARVECLQSLGLSYADLVASGCNLPVVDLAIHYHRSIQMGMDILVRAKLLPLSGVRIVWHYEICSGDRHTLYTTATVTLVPIDPQGKIMRRLPSRLQEALNAPPQPDLNL